MCIILLSFSCEKTILLIKPTEHKGINCLEDVPHAPGTEFEDQILIPRQQVLHCAHSAIFWYLVPSQGDLFLAAR